MNSGGSMLINANTKVKALLDVKQDEVIQALVKLNRNFGKLKNPVLRALLARRVTIAEACGIAKCKVEDFLDSMKKLGFQVQNDFSVQGEVKEDELLINKADKITELDVRPVLSQNQDPLKLILATVKDFKAGECLKLINSFEPVPLINLLGKKGFSYFSEQPEPHVFISYFTKGFQVHGALADNVAETHQDPAFEEKLSKFAGKIQHADVRELNMPQPMVVILEKLEHLPEDEALFVRHKKKPVFLFPELDARGFDCVYQNTPEGEVNLLIYKI
ncbi:DUF2249 domain-containing protein [Rubrolithibacter danxiaensis]|uniref:DUF2249 domain-containing protein n=1 Tax=Rubrolithibacter danxiaensis TaxID=3390805 RepID=UPI003BF7FACD